jgi:hypothetical protein
MKLKDFLFILCIRVSNIQKYATPGAPLILDVSRKESIKQYAYTLLSSLMKLGHQLIKKQNDSFQNKQVIVDNYFKARTYFFNSSISFRSVMSFPNL